MKMQSSKIVYRKGRSEIIARTNGLRIYMIARHGTIIECLISKIALVVGQNIKSSEGLASEMKISI